MPKRKDPPHIARAEARAERSKETEFLRPVSAAMVKRAQRAQEMLKPTPAAPLRIEAVPPFPTVAAYFAARLGDELETEREQEPDKEYSPYHPLFHIETGCGLSCRDAIDSAANLIRHQKAAFDDDETVATIVDACRQIVRCYVYG